MPITHHQERRQALYKLSRRTTVVMSGVVGALAGFMAVLFRVLLEQLDLWRTLGFPLLWADYGFVALAILVGIGALLGGLSAWLTQRYCPEAGGSGIPHVKAVLGYARPLRAARVMVTKIGAGLLALGAGMSLGREGPTVHIGGACAELFGRRFNFPVRTRRSLIAAGAGAGLAAAFNAPLAGFLFIMEELRKDMSRATYANALVTSVSAVGVTQLLLGYNAVFTLPAPQPLYLNAIPALVLLGILGSLVGVAFNRLLLAASASSGFKVHKGVLAGAIAALLTLTFPEVTGGGNELTLSLLEGEGSSRVWSGLALLLFVKLMFTVFCYSSGVPGGFFAPLLTMGAILGSLVSVLMTKFVPAWTTESGQLAIVGMAVVLTASVRAPLTGVVLIVEMTRWYHLLYSLLFASMVLSCAD